MLSSLGSVPHPLILKPLHTNELRHRGFMGWTRPPNDHYGMVFLHTHEHPQSYWMHTVPFNIDCLGFDKHNQLVEVMTLNALSKASRSFMRAVQHVVEVRGGWCKDHGVITGSKLRMRAV